MAWLASASDARHYTVEDSLQAPPAVYLGPNGFQHSKQPADLNIERLEVGEPTPARRGLDTVFRYSPRRNRLRRYPALGRQKWCISLGIMIALTMLFCVLAIVHRIVSQRSESGHGSLKAAGAERTPFVCGTDPDHWKCTTRFAGPKAADMVSRAALTKWMDQYCVFQAPHGDFWLCGAGLDGDHGLTGGEGTWVEKVSDEMMQTIPAKHSLSEQEHVE